jgi:hypothetical protein
MPPEGFEPEISAGEWPQAHALDRAATGISFNIIKAWKTKRFGTYKPGRERIGVLQLIR